VAKHFPELSYSFDFVAKLLQLVDLADPSAIEEHQRMLQHLGLVVDFKIALVDQLAFVGLSLGLVSKLVEVDLVKACQ